MQDLDTWIVVGGDEQPTATCNELEQEFRSLLGLHNAYAKALRHVSDLPVVEAQFQFSRAPASNEISVAFRADRQLHQNDEPPDLEWRSWPVGPRNTHTLVPEDQVDCLAYTVLFPDGGGYARSLRGADFKPVTRLEFTRFLLFRSPEAFQRAMRVAEEYMLHSWSLIERCCPPTDNCQDHHPALPPWLAPTLA
jgi:hypothetical protein